MRADDSSIRVAGSAHRHGVPEADILHAYRNASGLHFIGGDAVMLIGPGRNGAPLEIGVRYHPDVDCDVIFHAMAARRKYLSEQQ